MTNVQDFCDRIPKAVNKLQDLPRDAGPGETLSSAASLHALTEGLQRELRHVRDDFVLEYARREGLQTASEKDELDAILALLPDELRDEQVTAAAAERPRQGNSFAEKWLRVLVETVNRIPNFATRIELIHEMGRCILDV